ncbi:MAG: AAA family ATPase [Nitrospirae bacterium]|nr:AAA family ATPase [Nitrospirota bacterium]
MKIVSLNIKAFGPFTGKCLDLSGGQEGFHVVYGANEAGKTAALRALKALLFGIPERTRDTFVHEGRKLRIGARICHSDGTTLLFQRRKGRSRTLLSEDELELSESDLAKFLGSIDETAFSLMFGLGHEDLVKGGREIVDGKGDLGQSLFAAGAGVSGLRKVLSGLEEEADGLFKPRSQTASINAAIGKYKDSKKEIQSASLLPKEWEEHEHRLDAALRKKEEVSDKLRVLRTQLNRLERIQRALPVIGKWNETIARREKLGEVLILPESFSTNRMEIMNTLEHAEGDRKRETDHIERTAKRIDSLQVPEELLNQETVITEIHKKLGSHLKAMHDLPELQGEMNGLRREAGNILKDLRPGAALDTSESFRLSVTKRRHILSLASEHQGLTERLGSVGQQLQSLEARKSSAEDELRDIGEPVDVVELKRAIADVQKDGELERQAADARTEQRQTEQRTQLELKKLPMWSGTLEELETLPIPSMETLERFERTFSAMEKKIINLESLIKDKRRDISELQRNVESLEISGDVPTETTLLQSRKSRDALWLHVKAAWLGHKTDEGGSKPFYPALPLDRAYEKSVGEADEIADRLRREVERVTQKALWLASGNQALKDVAQLETDKESILIDKNNFLEQWNRTWNFLGIAPLSPGEMRIWVQKHQNLVTAAEKNRGLHEKARRLEERLSTHCLALEECLSRFDAIKSADSKTKKLSSMIDKGLSLVEMNEDIERRRSGLQHTISEFDAQLAEATQTLDATKRELDRWERQWEAAVGELGLEPDIKNPSAAVEFINRSQELFEKLDRAQGLEERIIGIEKEGRKFGLEVSDLVAQMAPDLAGRPVEQAAAELYARLLKAREHFATLGSLKQERESHRKDYETAMDTIGKMEYEFKGLLRQAGCLHPEEIEEVEARSTLALSLKEEIEQLGKQLLAHAAGVAIEKFIADAGVLNPDSLPLEIKAARDSIRDLEEELSVLDRTIGSEQTELRKMDGTSLAAEAAERAEVALANIVDNSERYIRLKLASAILRGEIERYRARNQGPVLARASEILASLTLGSFSRLKMAYNESDVPILVGIRPGPDEPEVRVEGMSDGTCDQLFLSLRLASLERYMEHNEPMPFIIDDVLVNFDDDRSEASLRVLADLSKKTQIIFFTHHRHLLDLAGKAVPSGLLKVHSL